jgi:hypothetical protein
MAVIEATAVSCGAHERGIVLAVLAGTEVACNIRLSDHVAGQLAVALRDARDAQRKLEERRNGER